MSTIELPAPFDPADGLLVREPERAEPGYWVGCPSVLVAGELTWLTYRQRRPRGDASDRGWRCAIAVSRDGIRFEDVWEVRKEHLDSPSMERFDLVWTDAGYELYLSYVDPADNRWRIDVVSAPSPGAFDVDVRRPALTAASTATEGVKDPVVAAIGGETRLYASFAARAEGIGSAAHATADIYNTGATTHPTGFAIADATGGWAWQGTAVEVGAPGSWDAYQARLGAVAPVDGGFVGFYDGSASHEENYEERLGIATSPDGRSWRRATTAGPWITGPGASGSVRYVDVAVRDGRRSMYFEVTRPDGAHELRVVPG
ncbi:MAG TPA: hypothetical protein VFP22_08750 [Candidatus Limnocylindrales bacterium]|nr:hypothetical protein [Candidatus Limnocylindrales bacterium]